MMTATSDAMLAYHLQYNHYPPVPLGVIPFAREAIEHVAEAEFEHVIVWPNGSTDTAWKLVEDLHLDEFVQALLEGDDDE